MDISAFLNGPPAPPNPSRELPSQPSHLHLGVPSETESRTSKKRKPEQACDLCRKKKARCHGGTPSCASCEGRKVECSFTNLLRRRGSDNRTGQQQHRKGSLDLMAVRISRMEAMLRQRGFLQDGQAPTAHSSIPKTEIQPANFKEIIEDAGGDSVPSLCGTGLDGTIQTGLTVTGSNMEPPPLPDKERVLGRVEMWLKGVPPFVKVELEFGMGEENMGENG